MLKRKALIIAVFCLFFSLISESHSHAKIVIDINSPFFEKIPILVQPPQVAPVTYENRQTAEKIVKTLVKDLMFEGFFEVYNAEQPPDDQKLDYRVSTDLIRNGQSITAILKLFDLSNQSMLVGRRYIASPSDVKKIGHRFANEIVLAITGRPGLTLSRIVFVSDNGSKREIYSASFDGSDIRQETSLHTIVMSPRYSPDGRYIAFTAFKTGRPCLYLKDTSNGKIRRISCFKGVNMSPAWHPSGKKLAVALSKGGSPDIYLIDLHGKVLRRLTRGPGINVSPSFSPDGRQIVFVSDRAGGPQLYLMDVATGKSRRLTYSGSYNTDPQWSPAGDRIVYVSRINGKFQIFTISPQGGDPVQLTFEGSNENPSWSPDGRQILFSSTRIRGDKHLFAMQANGQDQRLVVKYGRRDYFPFWGPNTFK
ncbi:MAG: Tol-Pal system beta propeller repeat protein TolB [Thermodesulfobacteria bacterium]|nr:Tol-Pal system beta propeller repeat protein TolB [Thermodesulfobacteriota bacterium]